MANPTTRHASLQAAMTKPTRPPRPRWPEDHLKVLRERYHLDTAVVLAERLGHTPGSIRTKASTLGLGKRGKHRPAVRAAQPSAPVLVAKPAPQPVMLPATPVLNAGKQAKAKKDAQPSAIAKMLEQMRNLPAGHPRRVAYMLAARTGNGQDAYQAWLNWKPQPLAA